MSLLDLRREASAPEPEVTEPPGLDRVRRWLAPLRRFFRGVWLWVRYLWRGAVAFWTNAVPGTLRFLRGVHQAVARFGRATGRYALGGKRRARATARFLRAMGRSGARLQATGRNWSRAEGRLGRLGAGMARAGSWVRVGAEGSAELVLGIGDIAGELEELAPEGPERDADEALRRLLPRGPARPEARRGNESPDRPPASLDTGPADTTPAKRDIARPASGRRKTGARTPSPGDGAAVNPAPEERAPVAPPAGVPRATSPSGGGGRRQLRPDPPDDLPFALRGEILALRERPPQERTRQVILAVCAAREWVQPAELARWLGVGASNLTKRHLGPLTNQGLLERRYPDAPRHRLQAYRTTAAGKAGGA